VQSSCMKVQSAAEAATDAAKHTRVATFVMVLLIGRFGGPSRMSLSVFGQCFWGQSTLKGSIFFFNFGYATETRCYFLWIVASDNHAKLAS
jgi:hypothetical protein